jgi:hypothetical protein
MAGEALIRIFVQISFILIICITITKNFLIPYQIKIEIINFKIGEKIFKIDYSPKICKK